MFDSTELRTICQEIDLAVKTALDERDRLETERLEEATRNFRPTLRVVEPQASLRDQLAMAALTGYLAQGPRDCTPEEVLHDCYRLADAGMKARKDTRTDTIIPKDIPVDCRDGVDYPAVAAERKVTKA